MFLNNLLDNGADLLNNLADRGDWGNGTGRDGRTDRGGGDGGSHLGGGGLPTDFDKVRLDFTGLGIAHDPGGVLNDDQVAQGVDVAVLAAHISTVALFLVSNISLFVVIGYLVGISVLGIGL